MNQMLCKTIWAITVGISLGGILSILIFKTAYFNKHKIESILLCFSGYMIFLYPLFNGFLISSDSQAWANLGAYIGGIGSLLTIGVLYLAINQYNDLRKNRNEDIDKIKIDELVSQINLLMKMRKEDYDNLKYIDLGDVDEETPELLYEKDSVFEKLIQYSYKVSNNYKRFKGIKKATEGRMTEDYYHGIFYSVHLMNRVFLSAKVILVYDILILNNLKLFPVKEKSEMYRDIFDARMSYSEKLAVAYFSNKYMGLDSIGVNDIFTGKESSRTNLKDIETTKEELMEALYGIDNERKIYKQLVGQEDSTNLEN